MNEQLSQLTHKFYGELTRVADNPELWIKATEFAFYSMLIERLDNIHSEIECASGNIEDIERFMKENL